MALNQITEAIDIAQKRAALKAELDSLEKQETEAKARAHVDAVAQAQALIEHFKIASDELLFTAKLTLPPRFRHPETGDTWHGYGQRPYWINDDNIDEYRIKPLKNGKKTSKKSSTKKSKQAEPKTAQPMSEQSEAGDATAEVAAVASVPKSEFAVAAADATPEATHIALGQFTQLPVGTHDQQPASSHDFPLCAAGVQSYVTAVRDAWSS